MDPVLFQQLATLEAGQSLRQELASYPNRAQPAASLPELMGMRFARDTQEPHRSGLVDKLRSLIT